MSDKRRFVLLKSNAHIVAAVFLMLFLGIPSADGEPRDGQTLSAPPSDRYDLPIGLTTEEKTYLASLPTLRLGMTPDWEPFTFLDAAGQPTGISGDYLKYIERSLGLHMERVPSDTWKQTLQLADEGKVDIVASITQHTRLAAGFLLTRAYAEYPVVIVTREDAPFINGLAGLKGARVAILEGSDAGFSPDSHGVLFQLAPSATDGIGRVARGAAFAYVGNLNVVEHIVHRSYPGVLRVAAPTGYSETLHFGVNAKYDRLVSLIDRVLRAVPAEGRARIQNTWLATRLEYKLPARTLWHVIMPVALVVIGFVCLLGVIIVFLRREVKQRRWTERELRYQWQFQQMLMKTVPIPIFVKDLENSYVAVNPAYEDTVGVRAGDLIGKTSLQAAHVNAVDADAFHEISQHVIATGQPANGSIQYVSKHGETRDAMYWLRLCYGADDSPRAVLGASIDLTELRQTERREMQLKRQLEELTRMLPAVTFQLRFMPGWGFVPVFVSDYASNLVGLTPDILTQNPRLFVDRVSAADWRRVQRALLGAILNESTREVEFQLMRAPGDVAWVRLEAASRPDTGSAHLLSGYLIDVTPARRQAEALEVAWRAAEEASQVKDRFLATMSHEIRTPMSGMVGVLDLLNRSTLRDEEQHLLDMARGSAVALMRILNDILDFSKNQQGELTLESLSFQVRDLIDDVTGLFEPEMHRKGLRFDVRVQASTGLQHVGDAHRIKQVLLNLVSNALKFTDTGAVTISIAAEPVVGGMQRLRFSVSDTGIGVAADQTAALFSPFTQADSSTSRRFGGTGLGLAICKQIIEAMGGVISVLGRPQGGTEVIAELTLPVMEQAGRTSRSWDAWLSVGDLAARAALEEFLKALNVRPVTEQDSIAPCEETLLVFRDNPLSLPRVERPLLVFDVTPDGDPSVAPPPALGRSLSINPLRWGQLVAALRLADDAGETVPPSPPAPASASFVSGGSLRPGAVLVVEDQAINQELLVRQLAALHIVDCDVACDGQEGLHAMERRTYSLVITDCAMPIMDGVELISRIRTLERHGRRRTYLVALTANATDNQREACHAAGVDEVLLKPLELDQLAAVLVRAARQTSGSGKAPLPVDVYVPPGIPPDQMPALLQRLRRSFEDDLAKLQEAYLARTLDAAAEAAHRILGASRWFKLEAIAHAAQRFEDAARAGTGHEEVLGDLKNTLAAFFAR